MENQNLLYSIIEKYFKNYPNKEDLFQVGAIGFINAYYKFDESFGAKFTTYAYPYIFGEMKKLVREDKSIKISREIHKTALLIERTTQLLRQALMREPTISDISYELGISELEVVQAIKSTSTIHSMDETIYSDGKDMTLADFVGDDRGQNLDEILMVREQLEELSEFERKLIEGRYFSDLTQAEVARQLGISQVQVSRNEQKIFSKIKPKLAA